MDTIIDYYQSSYIQQTMHQNHNIMIQERNNDLHPRP